MLHKGIPGALVVLTAGSALATVLGVVSNTGSKNIIRPVTDDGSQRVSYKINYNPARAQLPRISGDFGGSLGAGAGMPEWLTKDTGRVEYPAAKFYGYTMLPDVAPKNVDSSNLAADTSSFAGASLSSTSGAAGGIAYAFRSEQPHNQSDLAVDLRVSQPDAAKAKFFGASDFSGSNYPGRRGGSAALAQYGVTGGEQPAIGGPVTGPALPSATQEDASVSPLTPSGSPVPQVSNVQNTAVPAPGSVVIAGLGLGGLVTRRRSR